MSASSLVVLTRKPCSSYSRLKVYFCFIGLMLLIGLSIDIYLQKLYSAEFTFAINTTKTSAIVRQNEHFANELRLNFENQYLQYKELVWKTPASLNVIFSDKATILFPSGYVFNKSHSFDFGKWYWKSVKNISNKKHLYKNNFVFSFIQIWNNYFQHIVFDTLPKAYLICSWLQQNTNIIILVYNKLQMELIQFVCMIPKGRFFILTSSMKFKGIYLSYFGDSQYKMGIIPPGCLQSFRSRLMSGSDVIYLPRTRGQARSVNNEKDVLNLLRRYWPNLKIVNLTNNWKQDKQHFISAKIIIGPHGGAMSNMIFAPTNTTIVEFLPIVRLKLASKNERPCYLGLAKGLGFSYTAVEPEIFSFESAMKISLPQLETVVKQVFSDMS